MGWRLDAVLRLRSDAEDRAAVVHARAVGVRKQRAEAVDAAAAAWESIRARGIGAPATATALFHAGVYLETIAARVRAERRSLDMARQAEEAARREWAQARRDRRALEMLRDRECDRRRRTRERGADDDVAESARRATPPALF
jgi:flagellar export protein FliJ